MSNPWPLVDDDWVEELHREYFIIRDENGNEKIYFEKLEGFIARTLYKQMQKLKKDLRIMNNKYLKQKKEAGAEYRLLNQARHTCRKIEKFVGDYDY